MYRNQSRTRLLASAAILSALMLGGCQTAQIANTTGSVAQSTPRGEVDWRHEADSWGERYRKNPRDPEAGVRFAQALRSTGQRTQAVAVLEQASIHNPRNTVVLGAYGRALADTGAFAQALDVLKRAHSPDQPDWRILSVQGAVLDQMGRHEEARRHYMSALRIVPDEPSVMSNLGLSYALSKNLNKAEDTLRRASTYSSREPKVRQNLALVVGLQGRFKEAEEIARADLSPEEAAANLDYLRHMLAAEKGQNGKRMLRQAANNS
ncbi:tetratricopeptide repeat protein [Pseudorhodoplanes sp.]|uniref:tetratricopeptide repeat protein n=1 Tax=Pseudorhodoplanes sp. TaxID=1934341 RepID=UPI003D09A000